MAKESGLHATLTFHLPEESYKRFKNMRKLSGGTTSEVGRDAFRIYEKALQLMADSEEKGGVVYLTVKFPDGSTTEEPIFEPALDS